MPELTFRRLEETEQKQILPLLGRCFPEYWEQIAAAAGKMPFREISFAAFDGAKAVGHCGIIPYEIWCDGEVVPMAGVASVATVPEYRRMGIARRLCETVAAWAANRGFRSLPLYTGYFHVYESAGWRKLEVPPAREVVLPSGCSSCRWRRSGELSAGEREQIVGRYEETAPFDGKVIRKRAGELHSWERMFAEPEFRFSVEGGAYAIGIAGVVVETGFPAEMSGEEKRHFFFSLGDRGRVTAYLPPTEDNLRILSESENVVSSADVMHGERPMVLDLNGAFHRLERPVFFPAADKF